MDNRSPTAFDRSFLLRAVGLGLGAIGLAVLLRYGLVEPRTMGFQCVPDGGPWWCVLRKALVVSFTTKSLGWASVLSGTAALFLGWRGAAGLALLTGGLGLVLYNTGLASVGFLFGLIAAVRAARG